MKKMLTIIACLLTFSFADDCKENLILKKEVNNVLIYEFSKSCAYDDGEKIDEKIVYKFVLKSRMIDVAIRKDYICVSNSCFPSFEVVSANGVTATYTYDSNNVVKMTSNMKWTEFSKDYNPLYELYEEAKKRENSI